jgi:hypothetical protein
VTSKQLAAPKFLQVHKRARYYDTGTGEFISQDPLEYVDGMSQYRAYFVPGGEDPLGLSPCDCPEERGKKLGHFLPKGHSWGSHHFINWYFNSNNHDVSLKEIGLYGSFWSYPDVEEKYESVKKQLDYFLCSVASGASCEKKSQEIFRPFKTTRITDVTSFSALYSIGHSLMKFEAICEPIKLGDCCGECDWDSHKHYSVLSIDKRSYSVKCTVTRTINDRFEKPLGVGRFFQFDLWGGYPYGINSCYKEPLSFSGSTCDCADKFDALD